MKLSDEQLQKIVDSDGEASDDCSMDDVFQMAREVLELRGVQEALALCCKAGKIDQQRLAAAEKVVSAYQVWWVASVYSDNDVLASVLKELNEALEAHGKVVKNEDQ